MNGLVFLFLVACVAYLLYRVWLLHKHEIKALDIRFDERIWTNNARLFKDLGVEYESVPFLKRVFSFRHTRFDDFFPTHAKAEKKLKESDHA